MRAEREIRKAGRPSRPAAAKRLAHFPGLAQISDFYSGFETNILGRSAMPWPARRAPSSKGSRHPREICLHSAEKRGSMCKAPKIVAEHPEQVSEKHIIKAESAKMGGDPRERHPDRLT